MPTGGLLNLYRQIEAGEVDIVDAPMGRPAHIPADSVLFLKHGENGIHREFEVVAGRSMVRDVVKQGDHFVSAIVEPPVVEVRVDMGGYVAVVEDACSDCLSGVVDDPLVESNGVCGTCGRERR